LGGFGRRWPHAFVALRELAPFGGLARSVEQIEHQRIAAFIGRQAILEALGSAFAAESRVIGLAARSLLRATAIGVRLTQLLELELMTALAFGFLGAGHLAPLPIVELSRASHVAFDPFDALALAVVIANRAALLGAEAHHPSLAIFGGGSPAREPAAIHALFRFCLERLAGLELLTAGGDPARKCRISGVLVGQRRPHPGNCDEQRGDRGAPDRDTPSAWLLWTTPPSRRVHLAPLTPTPLPALRRRAAARATADANEGPGVAHERLSGTSGRPLIQDRHPSAGWGARER
jgi:hypothetical protein